MSKGKRYNGKTHNNSKSSKRGESLNYKKVVGVIIFVVLAIAFIFGIKWVLKENEDKISKVNITYAAVYTNNKWGVIDDEGNIVIEPTYDEMIQIPNPKKPIFICTYDTNYDTGVYKTKAINEKNKQIYNSYDLIEPIDNFKTDSNEFWYEENVLRVKKGGKFGIINFNGKELIKPEYEEITSLKGTKEHLLLKKSDKYGIADLSGKVIIEENYKEITGTGDSKNGYIVINEEGKAGYIAGNGEKLISPVYDDLGIVQAGDEVHLRFKKDDKFGVLNLDNTILLLSKYDDIKPEAGENNFIVKTDENWEVIDAEENVLLSDNYQNINFAFDDNYIVKREDKFSMVNTSGEIQLPAEYTAISYRKGTGLIECETAGNINTKILSKQFNELAERNNSRS